MHMRNMKQAGWIFFYSQEGYINTYHFNKLGRVVSFITITIKKKKTGQPLLNILVFTLNKMTQILDHDWLTKSVKPRFR